MVPKAAFEIRAYRQFCRGDDLSSMPERLIPRERVIQTPERKCVTRAGSRQGFEAEMGQQTRRSRIVRVGDDERIAAFVK